MIRRRAPAPVPSGRASAGSPGLPSGRTEVLTIAGCRVRIGPWRGSPTTGLIALVGDEPPPTRQVVEEASTRLAQLGYLRANTGAVPEQSAEPFLDAGYHAHERLHLLTHPLAAVERVPRGATRRARRTDRPAVLALDRAAFEPFWQLDAAGLEDSLLATPVSRFRVTDHDGVTGYAVFGWAADRGYLQRLAVRPDAWGRGLGEVLVRDGLRWLQRRGAHSALVNTQEHNERGLRLYERLGFVLEHHGLLVLSADLGPFSPPSGDDRARGGGGS